MIIQVIVATPLTQLQTALETFARSVCLQHLLLEASRLVERIIILSLVFIEESERLLALSQSLISLPDTFQIDNWRDIPVSWRFTKSNCAFLILKVHRLIYEPLRVTIAFCFYRNTQIAIIICYRLTIKLV